MPFCQKCGEAYQEGEQFCPKCGAKLGTKTETPTPTPKQAETPAPMAEAKKVTKITVGGILAWIFGAIFIVAGFVTVLNNFIGGLFITVGALIIFPPTNNILKKNMNIELSGGVRIILFIVFIAIGISLGGTEPPESRKEVPSQPIHQPIIAPLESLLLTDADMPTEWRAGTREKITGPEGFGVTEAEQITFSKVEGFSAVSLQHSLYKFSTIDGAKAYYKAEVGEIQARKGYEELSGISNVGYEESFGYTRDVGLSGVLKIISREANVVSIIWMAGTIIDERAAKDSAAKVAKRLSWSESLVPSNTLNR